MELNREQIIKVLECWATSDLCKGDECVLFNTGYSCARMTAKNALSLINELTEENERLKDEIDNGVEVCHDCHTKYAGKIEQAKADTVRKIVERLSDDYEFDCRADIDTRTISHSDLIEWVTQIAEEMLEGDR